MKLTAKQELFCQEYLTDLNATQSAIRAGYSPKTAYIIGHENLKKPYIAEHIAELRAKVSDKLDISIENIVKFIHEIALEAKEGADSANALKGADMLMKHLGGYVVEQQKDTVKLEIEVL